MRKVSAETLETLKLIAAGHSVKTICGLRAIASANVYQLKSHYPDVIAELQGKHMDGSPLCFPPGHGTESIAHMPPKASEIEKENEEMSPEDENINSMKKHTIAGLFREIDALKGENAKLKENWRAAEHMMNNALDDLKQETAKRAELEKQLAEAKGKTELDKGMLLSFLLCEIGQNTGPSDFAFIKGVGYAISYILGKSVPPLYFPVEPNANTEPAT